MKDFKEALKNQEFHLVFLDIDLDEDNINGIILGKYINKAMPYCQIIFITAYLQYVSDVYEVKHTYFVMKNEIKRYLPNALKKALDSLEKEKKQVLYLQNNRKTICIPQRKIIYIEREKRISKICTVDSLYTTYEKLEEIEKRLPAPSFTRCHRSFIIHFAFVRNLQSNQFLCEDDIVVPISRSYYPTVKKMFSQFSGNIL